ncbi:MAG: hypothetical protein ACK5Q5_22440 [Planctomycetaceae bacterium]
MIRAPSADTSRPARGHGILIWCPKCGADLNAMPSKTLPNDFGAGVDLQD